MSHIVSQRLNDTFIIELYVSEECEKKQHVIENRAWDNSLVRTILRNVRSEGDVPADEAQPPLESLQ